MRLRIAMLALAIGITVSACGNGNGFSDVPPIAEPVVYDVSLTGLPGREMREIAEEALSVYTDQEQGAPSLPFLRQRAESDIPVLRSLLRSRGYILPEIDVDIVAPDAEEETPALVDIVVRPGALFRLDRHDLLVMNAEPVPDLDEASQFGSPVGEAAVAADILGAEDAALARLQQDGYAYARFAGRDSLADPDSLTLIVESRLDAGRRYRIGPIVFEGVTVVEEEYLRSYIPWQEGDLFDGAALLDYQRTLSRTALFTSVSVDRPDEPPQGDILPVTVRVEERLPRTFSIGLRYNTERGAQIESSVTHRNLFGRNETATIRGELSETERIAGVALRVPQFGRSGQDLVASSDFTDTDEDAFSGQIYDARIGLERDVGDRWRAGAGLALQGSELIDAGAARDSLVGGIPLFLEYDSTRDRLDPRNGNRGRIEIVPWAGTVSDREVGFLSVEGRASAYRRLDEDGTFVAAVRARGGVILADDFRDVPAPLRFFSGGGGSVRGYAPDAIGPRDVTGDPRGGLSAVELGAEMRLRFTDTLGGVVFAESGIVDDEPIIDLDGDLRTGVGLGVRYFSPVGPIRADLAFPVDPRPIDDDFQFYLSIGQAF
ncbi:MAG: autotransporter assembly complex protein TamA [Rubricella sp.]